MTIANIKLEKTEQVLKDFNLQFSRTSAKPSSDGFLEYKETADKIKQFAEILLSQRNMDMKFSFSKFRKYKKYKEIAAMTVAPATLPARSVSLAVDEYVQEFAFDVLPYDALDRGANVIQKTVVVNHQSAGIPDRSLDDNFVNEGAPKRIYETIVQTVNINMVKLAYQELVTLEAERSLDALTYITERAMQKLMEIVHAYILRQLTVGAAVLPAAFFPGPGSYPQANMFSVLSWIGRRYKENTTSKRDRVYVFLDRLSAEQYRKTFDVGRGYWNFGDFEDITDHVRFIRAVDHYLSPPGYTAAPHPLSAAPYRCLIVPSDGYFLAIDDTILTFRDRIPQTNQTVVTAEMFLAVAPLPNFHGPNLTTTPLVNAMFDANVALANV